MQSIQLYANDTLLDTGDEPIALTFQINNLGDAASLQGNTSNQFKIPNTQNNRRALGYPDDLNINSETPYTKIPIRFLQNDVELPFTTAVINTSDNSSISLTLLSGNVDFFDLIGGQLYDMGDSTSVWSNYGANLPFAPYTHKWNLTNAANSQKKTEGWIYPVIDYGNFTENYSDPIDVRTQRPGFFIKTAIDLMLASAGYKGKGAFLQNPMYPLLISQFSNGSFEHGSDYQNQPDLRGINVEKAVQQVVQHPNALNPVGIISFSKTNSDPANQWNGVDTFTARDIITVQINVTIPYFYLYGRASGSHMTSVNINIYYAGTSGDVYLATLTYDFTEGYDEPRDSGSGGSIMAHKTWSTKTLAFNTDIEAGAIIQIKYEFLGDTPSYFVMGSGAILTIAAQNQGVLFGQDVQCERIFPDMSQKDLIKEVLQKFGIICQTDVYKRTVTFASYREIVANIPIAKDWTSRCLDQGKTVAYRLGNYGRVNYLRYATDNNVTPLKFAWSQINISDATLDPTADLFESRYAGTLQRSYIGGSIAQIKTIDTTGDPVAFSIGVEPRILIDQKTSLAALGKSVTFTDGVNNVVINDIISTPYFYKPDGPYDLRYDTLRKLYYPEFERILRRSKMITRYFLLTVRDISELDMLVPVYLAQEASYFYINKISNWQKGQPCAVDLVKIG